MDGADAQPVRLGLLAAARELERIADLGRDVQDAFSPLLRSLAATSPAEAQALDILVQQAEGLGQFLDALALQCPESWRVRGDEAVVGLGLAAQRAGCCKAAITLSPPATARTPVARSTYSELRLRLKRRAADERGRAPRRPVRPGRPGGKC